MLADKGNADSTDLHCEFMVIEAPRGLPDGIYTVTFDQYAALTQKLDGLWLNDVAGLKLNTRRVDHFPEAGRR
ncbi:MAG: hypothetical protein WCC14_13125 [Acidobacteriaceae bacterium]